MMIDTFASSRNRPQSYQFRVCCRVSATAGDCRSTLLPFINNMAHTPEEGIKKDILFGVQVCTKGQKLSQQGNRSDRDQRKQSSLRKAHPKPSSMDLKNVHKDLNVEDPRFLVNTILEELPTNQKFRLSPLAARAALASLVSSIQEDAAADGSKEFGSNVTKKLFMVNDLSSGDPSSTSVEVVTDLVNGEMEVKSSKKARTLENSSGRKGKKAKVECKTQEVIVSNGTETHRITRSARQKTDSCDVSNGIITTQSPAEEIPKKVLIARRITRSTIFEVNEEFTVKPEMEDVELIQTTTSSSSNRDREKKSIVAEKGATESVKVNADKKKIHKQSEGDYAKKTPELPVRVTRSAFQRGNCYPNASDVQKTSEETQARGSVKTRRSTQNTNLEETEAKRLEDLVANIKPTQIEGKRDDRKKSASTAKKQEEQVVFSPRITRSKSKS